MEDSEEGREILKLQPRINSNTVDLEKLKSYPEGTLGKAYSNFLEINVSLVRYINISAPIIFSKLLQIQECLCSLLMM